MAAAGRRCLRGVEIDGDPPRSAGTTSGSRIDGFGSPEGAGVEQTTPSPMSSRGRPNGAGLRGVSSSLAKLAS